MYAEHISESVAGILSEAQHICKILFLIIHYCSSGREKINRNKKMNKTKTHCNSQTAILTGNSAEAGVFRKTQNSFNTQSRETVSVLMRKKATTVCL